jgi:hypothetical protein
MKKLVAISLMSIVSTAILFAGTSKTKIASETKSATMKASKKPSANFYVFSNGVWKSY